MTHALISLLILGRGRAVKDSLSFLWLFVISTICLAVFGIYCVFVEHGLAAIVTFFLAFLSAFAAIVISMCRSY